MRKLIIVVCMLLPVFTMAQTGFGVVGMNGMPIPEKVEYMVEGSPFYNKDYCTGTIKLLNGPRYVGLLMKLDLMTNRVQYRLPDGSELMAGSPVASIAFDGCDSKTLPATFRTGFPAIDRQTTQSFYQVLDSGSVSLLKFWKIDFTEQTPYGSSTKSRKYETTPMYYAYSAEKGMLKLGKSNDDILKLFSDKKEQLNKFVADQGIRVKKEEDLVKLFAFYNRSGK